MALKALTLTNTIVLFTEAAEDDAGGSKQHLASDQEILEFLDLNDTNGYVCIMG